MKLYDSSQTEAGLFPCRCFLAVVLVLCTTRFTMGGRLSTASGTNMMPTTTITAAQMAEHSPKTAVKVQICHTLLIIALCLKWSCHYSHLPEDHVT